MRHLTRRQFQQSLLAGAVGLSTGPALARRSGNDNPGWIDAHVHVWTPDTKTYPIAPPFSKKEMQPPSFTPAELFEQTEPVGVDRIVLIQMSFYQYDNSYMLDVIKKYPGQFGGVGIVDHQQQNLSEQMLKLSRAGVTGFRLHSRADNPAASWPTDEGMFQLWKTATEHNLACCPLINPQDIGAVKKLCEKFPTATVVIDHFARIGISGNVVQDDLKQLCELAKFPGVHVKTSAFYALGKKTAPYTDLLPMIRQVYEAYGSERLMWASDCPYQVQPPHTYEASLALIRDQADFLTDEEKNNILRNTAERLFFRPTAH